MMQCRSRYATRILLLLIINLKTFTINHACNSIEYPCNYKFNALSLAPSNASTVGNYKLVNATQNDGGSGSEAFYTGSFAFSQSDSSSGSYLFNLNGQALYVDRFNNMTGLSGKGLSFVNDAVGSTSDIRAVGTTGDTLVGGSFRVLNGATLQFTGGDVNNVIFNRSSPIGIAADTAAAPNGGGGGSGGAIYNDGNTMTLSLFGTLIEANEVNAHGSAIFFITNDHTGTLHIEDSWINFCFQPF